MVLLTAVALDKVAYGLLMILVFSLGLASVLIVIGVLMVKAKDFMSDKLTESGILRVLPYVSATVITIVGFLFLLRAMAASGAL